MARPPLPPPPLSKSSPSSCLSHVQNLYAHPADHVLHARAVSFFHSIRHVDRSKALQSLFEESGLCAVVTSGTSPDGSIQGAAWGRPYKMVADSGDNVRAVFIGPVVAQSSRGAVEAVNAVLRMVANRDANCTAVAAMTLLLSVGDRVPDNVFHELHFDWSLKLKFMRFGGMDCDDLAHVPRDKRYFSVVSYDLW